MACRSHSSGGLLLPLLGKLLTSKPPMSKWFYYNENGDKIDVTGGQLKGLAKAGMITPETIVETEEGKTARAGKVKGLTFVEVAQQTPPAEPETFTAEERVEIDKFLAKYGSDVKAVNEHGMALLHTAILLDGVGVGVIKFLISQGADVNAKDKNNQTPLFWAMYKRKIEIAKLLISKGADVNEKDKDGDTLLHSAASRGNIESVHFLVSQRVNINAKGNRDDTPLHRAANEGKIEVVQFLVNKGAEVDAKNKNGSTPLYTASFAENIEVAKFLISQGANVNTKGDNSTTMLHSAAYSGKIDIVKFLVSNGADIGAKNSDGRTPLNSARLGMGGFTSAATKEGCMAVVQYLTSINAPETDPSKIKKPPLPDIAYQALASAEKLVEITGGERAQETMHMLRQADSRLPVHPYKTCILPFLAVIPIICGILIAGLAFVNANVHGAGASTMPAFIAGVIITIFGILGTIVSYGRWHRCPSCDKSWAVTMLEIQALHNLRTQNITQNNLDPIVQLPCKCKHCGYKWIYQWG